MLWIAILLGVLLLSIGYMWWALLKENKELTRESTKAQMTATVATQATKVLAEQVQERDEKIAELATYVYELAGSDGLAELLNRELLSDDEGGDGGLPN